MVKFELDIISAQVTVFVSMISLLKLSRGSSAACLGFARDGKLLIMGVVSFAWNCSGHMREWERFYQTR